MVLSVLPPITSRQIPHLGPFGDGGHSRAEGSAAAAAAALVLRALFLLPGEATRGLFGGLGTGGRLLETISISGDPVRSITPSLSWLFSVAAAARGTGMGLDPLAKFASPMSSSYSSWLSRMTISSSYEEFIVLRLAFS